MEPAQERTRVKLEDCSGGASSDFAALIFDASSGNRVRPAAFAFCRPPILRGPAVAIRAGIRGQPKSSPMR
jgi:hypothetical protein